jgi:hypothetical protein
VGKNLQLFLDSMTIPREGNPAPYSFLVECGNLGVEITECGIDNYQSLNSQRYDNCTGRVLERMRLLEGMARENDGQENRLVNLYSPCCPYWLGRLLLRRHFFSESPAAGPIARDVLH